MEAGRCGTSTGNLRRSVWPLHGCVKRSRKREDRAERALSARLWDRNCCRGKNLASTHSVTSGLGEMVTTCYLDLSRGREFSPG